MSTITNGATTDLPFTSLGNGVSKKAKTKAKAGLSMDPTTIVAFPVGPSEAELRLRAELDAAKAENAALRTKAAQTSSSRVSFKVSEKGAVSVYGLGRFPVTLYKEQWERLLAVIPSLKDFISAHEAELSVKQPK